MPMDSITAGAILLGFVIFITMRGELPKYAAIIGLA